MNTLEEYKEENAVLNRRVKTQDRLITYHRNCADYLRNRNRFLVKANRIYFTVGAAGTVIGFLLGWLVV